jgi:GNAT superfamily N-acetyltransferase
VRSDPHRPPCIWRQVDRGRIVAAVRFGPDYEETRRLADGTLVRLRLLRPTDRAKLLAGFAELSEASRYSRFFTAMPELPERMLERLLHTDDRNHVAIAAEAGDVAPDSAPGYGVARFLRLEETPDVAEAAVVVVDRMQRRGLGKLLLSRLAAAARERGITRFRAEVLRTNHAVVSLLDGVDGAEAPRFDGPVAIYELGLPGHGEEEAHHGPLFGFLRLAASGLDVLLRRLLPDRHPPSP